MFCYSPKRPYLPHVTPDIVTYRFLRLIRDDKAYARDGNSFG